MTKLSVQNTGLTLGALIGLFHAGWALLIAIGFAQPLLDWIFHLHMIQPVYHVMPFSIVTALGLVIFTSIVGYIMGCIFAIIWNAMHKA